MTLEVRDIPPAPRRVRWSAVVWHRFGLLLGGVLLTVYGGVLTLLLWIGDSSSYHQDAEHRLDAEAQQTVGKVLSVEPGENWQGRPKDLVRFEFTTPDGRKETGVSFCTPESAAVGAEATVEFVREHPHISRLLGGHVVFGARLYEPAFWLTIAPGLVLLWLWIAGVLGLRRTLRDGDAAIAEPLEVRRLGLMLPTMLEVRFRFRDHHAQIREGRHWVRARSTLGQRLLTAGDRPKPARARVLWRPGQPLATSEPTDWQTLRSGGMPRLVVVHDRTFPHRNRLVAAADFVHAAAPPRALPPRAWLG